MTRHPLERFNTWFLNSPWAIIPIAAVIATLITATVYLATR